MIKKIHNILFGVSVSTVLMIASGFADTITGVQVIGVGNTFSFSDVVANSFNTGAYEGGVISNAGTVIINGTSQFNDNTGSTIGGVISNKTTGTLKIGNVSFDGNEGGTGAVLYNLGDAEFTGTSFFTGNTAQSAGGAISNGGMLTFDGDAVFTDNNVTNGTGGAIYNEGKITFDGLTTFNGNESLNGGIAIQNESTGVINFNGGLVSSGNNSSYVDTAGINNSGTITVVGGDVVIYGNTAYAGAGMCSVYENAVLLLGAYLDDANQIVESEIDNITFQNNTATDGTAGALYAGGDTELYATNILFDNNDSNVGGYGGAIALQGGILKIIGDNNTFTNNDANAFASNVENQVNFGGGAIQNIGSTTPSNITIGDENSINTFTSNTSASYGGAIHIRSVGASDVAFTILNGDTTFVYNQATLNGGAISNYVDAGYSELIFNGDTVFNGNSANGIGGAIYNAGLDNGVITFNGDVTFSGNSDSTGANDIYNDGTINFNGNVKLDGGITGTGTLVLADGKFLSIGNAGITQSIIEMNGGTIVAMIDNADYDGYLINVGKFNGEGTIALTLGATGTYALFGDAVPRNTLFEGNITFDSPIYNLSWVDDNRSVFAERKTADQIASDNGVSQGAASTLLHLMDSSSDKLKDLSLLLQQQLVLGHLKPIEKITLAIRPEKGAVLQSVGTSVQSSIAKLAAGRMALLQQSIGRSGGDAPVRNGIWVEGMYNKSKQNDAFNGYTRGIVAGIDTIVARGFMLGVGYSYAHSDISAFARDTEIDSNTIFVYGQYKPTAWYMNAMLNYTMSDYIEESNELGEFIESDYDVNSLGVQVVTGYDFAGGITPEVGLRYMHITADEYKNSLGVKNKLDGSDYLTAVLRTKYASDYRVARGFTLRPELRYAMKYDLVSDKQVATVIIPGIDSYELDGTRLSRIGAEFGAGLLMKYQDFSLALNYDIEVREGYTSQTGRVRARMVF